MLGGFASFDLAIIAAGMLVLSEGYMAMRPVCLPVVGSLQW
jgi:hypothetical protein